MNLGELRSRLPEAELQADPSLQVETISHDSRRSAPGGLFVAIRGLLTDGNRFVEEARK